ncbi:MAG: hypothetical protein RLZZ224_1773 [Verrucomicrobiota bacterium]
MSSTPLKHQETDIPESLKKLLAQYRRKLWRTKISEAAAASLIGLIVSFLIVFVLDRLVPTTGGLRLLILLLGASFSGLFAPWWLRRWVWGHRYENDLARLISRQHPDLGDRLLGILELRDQHEQAESLSPRLRLAAMEAVAQEAQQRDLAAAQPGSWIKKALIFASLLVVAASCAFFYSPQASWNSLRRWALPLQETERFTFTKWQTLPTEWIVAHGESSTLTVRLATDTTWRPAQGEAQLGQRKTIVAQLVEDRYDFALPALTQPTRLTLRIGDAQHSMQLIPTHRPTIQQAIATLRYPSYLQRENQTIDLSSGIVSAVVGSEWQWSLTADRPLKAAGFGPIRALTPAEPKDSIIAPVGVEGSMTIAAERATSPPIQVGEQSLEVPFSWTDAYGLSGDRTWKLRLDVVADQPPSSYLQGTERQHVMLPEETVDLEALAEDDFGLRELLLQWQGENSLTGSTTATAKGQMVLLPGSPTSVKLTKSLPFCPATLGIGPQKLLIRSVTTDYLPNRPATFSEPITLFILTRDEHAQMLKNQFDRVVGELEDATRREQNAYEENQRIDRLNAEELQQEPNRTRLEAQQKAEQENTQRLEQLEKRMEQLLQGATRNGEIDKETMKQMAEAMKSLGELSRQDMPKVEKNLGESQQPNNTPEQAKKELKDALAEQKKVLEKMQQTLEQSRNANQNMEASTFVNRLKKAASELDAIATSLIDSSEQAAGLSHLVADPRILSQLTKLDQQLSTNASDIRWIQEDLGHFFTRTNQPVYQKILDAMRDSSAGANIDGSLEGMRDLLKNNQTFRSIQTAAHWSGQLKSWAKMLDDSKDSGSSGGGGEGGGGNPEDEDFEFMLRVMKLIQKEQDLRNATRALEELKRSALLSP